MNDFKFAIQYFEKSMLEDSQYKVKEELKVVQKLQQETEAKGDDLS
jgi:hypothetical protein